MSARRRFLLRAGAVVWLLAAAAGPVLAWHGVAARLAESFRLHLGYLVTAWGGYSLMALGLVCLVPVVLTVGRVPNAGRLYPQRRSALAGWGASLYLLGLALSVQVAQIARLS